MKISQAVRLDRNGRIAFVGAGGKTTSMFRTARQYGGKILLSATAHLAEAQLNLADKVFVIYSVNDIDRIEANLVDGINLIIGSKDDNQRMQGLDDDSIECVKSIADKYEIPLLIEADGARMRPLKAPAAHEPPIPTWINFVIVVAGLSAVGKSLDEQNVFRPEVFARLVNAKLGSQLAMDQIYSYLLHERGGLKNIPPGAKRALIFTQADIAAESPPNILEFKKALLEQYQSILVASMLNADNEIIVRHENIAGVILAAGQSERFGSPKQLLDWKGKPFIRKVVETAIAGGLDPVVVVLGAVVEPIINVLQGLPVNLTINPAWSAGLSTSIRAGVQQIEKQCQGALFLMSDMPQIPVELIRQQLEFQSTHNYYILVPRVNGKRTNPAMFDSRCFHALKLLDGDVGGRELFDKFPVNWIDEDDPGMSMDVDTPGDYTVLKNLSTKNER